MHCAHLPKTLFAAFLLAQALPALANDLSIDRNAGPARLRITGEVGQHIILQSSDNPTDPNSWVPVLTLPLTNNLQSWFDANSLTLSRRFYRAMTLATAPEPVFASNFRLIDHQGKSQELYYHTDTRAVVLIFTGNGCPNVQQTLATLDSLRASYANRGVLFWMIDANRGDSRSNIIVEASSLKINLPILHDEAQVVARSFAASTTPEAVCVNTADWTIFYRGAIDDRVGGSLTGMTQNYLANALANFLADQPVSPSQTQPQGCAIDFKPAPAISYSTHIAPLLQDKCARCHSVENIAPWAMTNYASVRANAARIKNEVLANRMPPWHADPFYGAFANDSSLKPEEKSMLLQWIDEGAPRGAGSDPLINLPAQPPDWALGTPSHILTIPSQSIAAFGNQGNGVEDYHYVNVPTSFATDVWLGAAIVRPGNRKIVHHCLVYSGTSSQLAGMDGFFAGYVPGYEPVAFPANTGKLLRKGTVLKFQMHYITTGTDETDQTQLGLYTLPVPPTYALQTKSAFNFLFEIPPGAVDSQATAQYPTPLLTGSSTLTKNILLYEMSPHMHLRGSRFQYEAVYPNGSREVLLSVPNYSFHWQTLYRLAQPKLIPAGSRIICTGAWDNSSLNPDNPDPSVTVGFGEQTFNEMFIGYFNFVEP